MSKADASEPSVFDDVVGRLDEMEEALEVQEAGRISGASSKDIREAFQELAPFGLSEAIAALREAKAKIADLAAIVRRQGVEILDAAAWIAETKKKLAKSEEKARAIHITLSAMLESKEERIADLEAGQKDLSKVIQSYRTGSSCG